MQETTLVLTIIILVVTVWGITLNKRDIVVNLAKKSLGVMFKTIALMDGDFDNGKSLVKTLRKHSGEELFIFFKINYPDKYEKLVKLDKKRER